MHPKTLLSLVVVVPLALAACGERRLSVPHRPAVTWNPTAATAPHLPVRIAPDLVVRRAQFGILETSADGDDRFVPAKEIPPQDGQVFGWVIEVETTRESLHWQEHLKLPRPPADWGDAATDPDIMIAKDGRSVVAQGEDLVEDGEVSRFYWALAAGDPAGDYELDLAVEGKPVAHFGFRVPAPVQEKAILVRDAAAAGSAPRLAATVPSPASGTGARVWR